uniref:hypothetical protein n=1 Tax=Klebsiella pneumoniae TaxID=573 RepID=UPI001C8F8736
ASQLIETSLLLKNSWATSWEMFDGWNKFLVSDPTTAVGGMNLARRDWTLLNRFRTGVGSCNYWRCKWGLTPDQSCDCGADAQTMQHIITECPLRSFREGLAGLHSVSEAGLQWLSELDLAL